MQFAKRTGWDMHETEWAKTLRERRASHLPIYDLTESNPTRCGFHQDEEILAPLSSAQASLYDPDPRGMLSARMAVCEYYRERGAELDPQQIVLTASTSEAYSFLFRLLCNPGDPILIAQPGYPLFEYLADLHDVALEYFSFFYDHGWQLDGAGLRTKIEALVRASRQPRAILLVHPNNPTGHYIHAAEREAILAICAEFDLALIVDEVFLDYAAGTRASSFLAGSHPALTFVLSGLSKIAALPQMKVAWIAARGLEDHLHIALQKLEVIADTYLSVNTPSQLALPRWLSGCAQIQEQIQRRVKNNLRSLDELLARLPLIRRLEIEAGWYAILRVPAISDGEESAFQLLRAHGVVLHPGSFFGMAAQGWFVLSLLPRENIFVAGIALALEMLEADALV